MKVGVFLMRAQPLHNAHLFMIKKMLLENDKILIILGSSNKANQLRNPFSFTFRKQMIDEAFWFLGISKFKYEILELPDWTQEGDVAHIEEWGHYLYYNIVRAVRQKTFSFYYNDDPNIALSWFSEEFKSKIDFKFTERSEIFNGLSATKIRNALLLDTMENREYINKYCPESVYKRYSLLSKIWIETNENPIEDFSME